MMHAAELVHHSSWRTMRREPTIEQRNIGASVTSHPSCEQLTVACHSIRLLIWRIETGEVLCLSTGTLSHSTSPAERERRHSVLRSAMSEAGYDALVIYGRGDEFVRGRIQYVSDIFTWAGWAIVVLSVNGEAVFIVDPLFGLGRATIVDWITDLRITQDPGTEIAGILSDLRVA